MHIFFISGKSQTRGYSESQELFTTTGLLHLFPVLIIFKDHVKK
jgi:hypothetical protein